jgi:RNA polymerase sigma factor (sigma-70 family)
VYQQWPRRTPTNDDATDAEAVDRARTGDRDAYALLVARHGALAHRTAYLLGAGADAEDVVQEAFVKAYRALGSFRPGAPFRPWLLRIVANETSNLHRGSRRRRTLELRLAEPDVAPAEPEREAVAADARARLLAAVNAMPYRDRQVLTCRYFLDLTEAETAEVLAWPRGSVKSRLSRAIDRLRRTLPARFVEEVARD